MVPPNQGSVAPINTRSPLSSEGAQSAQIGSTAGAMRTLSGNSLARYDPIAGGTARTRVSSTPSLGNQQDLVAANHQLPTLGNREISDGRRPVSPGSTPHPLPGAMGHSAVDLRPLHQQDQSSTGYAQRVDHSSLLPLDIKIVDSLQTLLGIDNNNQRLVTELCSMLASLPTAPVVPVAPVGPVTPGARDHHYHSPIRNICRHQIRSILMEPALEAYPWMHDPDGRMYTQTPLACMRRWVATQTTAFMAEHLPNQYEQGNTLAVASVNAFLRNLVKHERTTMRNLLLTNVKRDADRPRVGAVPRLYDLFFVIERGFCSRDQIQSNDAIERSMTPALRVRIAMIRMITAHHFLHRPPGDNQSQWDVIDDQLERIRTWSDHTKQAFTRLLVRRDRQLFTGRALIEDIDINLVRLPTDEEVEELRQAMAVGAGGQDEEEDEDGL
ncbi:hypothetical protein PCASD_17622 [Puccinia coronata f. sp. avenae]|uniref:Uncharacterized protein n=1 Tax=Puccinia coronata f. sp. avenae TaxID=200324 RepID=A0A2N5TTW1_9BASI|nr:hypothetical protein PCASD_17622 [Puccinia coronata f. sp. avenae]